MSISTLQYILEGFFAGLLFLMLGSVVLLIISEITKKLESKKINEDDNCESSRGFYHIEIGIISEDDDEYSY